MVVKNDKVIGIYDEFVEAFRTVIETPGGELYRIELVASMKEEEAGSVRDLLTAEVEPVEAPVGRTEALEKVVVLDPETDPHDFLSIMDSFENIVFYVNSRKIDEETRLRYNAEDYDADSEEDFIKFLEALSLKAIVVLVTSNKKLYVKSLGIRRVKPIFRSRDQPVDEILIEVLKN